MVWHSNSSRGCGKVEKSSPFHFSTTFLCERMVRDYLTHNEYSLNSKISCLKSLTHTGTGSANNGW